eukprot:1159277-Pelagomonas_calceolata.AAC.5
MLKSTWLFGQVCGAWRGGGARCLGLDTSKRRDVKCRCLRTWLFGQVCGAWRGGAWLPGPEHIEKEGCRMLSAKGMSEMKEQRNAEHAGWESVWNVGVHIVNA